MTKSSSSRKYQSAKKLSKISMLRRKLTLKTRKSPIITNEAVTTDDQKIAVNVKKDKLFQRVSPMKLVRLYPSMTNKQKDLIKLWGYGGLVDIKCSKLHPGLCKFLMESFDPSTCKLVFAGRGAIAVTEESVEQVIGVPRGDMDVRYAMDAEAISFMTEQLGMKSKRQPTITSLEKKLAGMKEGKSTYLRLFITYGMCSVLAPTTGVHINPRLYPSLVNIKNANRLNMCKFVIMMLRKATKTRSEKGILKSCMLYFMVKYLDSLQLEGIDVRSEGTRVSVWTNALVNKAISQDQRSDGTFGLAPLKPEFANLETPSEAQQEPTMDTLFQADQGTSNSEPFAEGEQLEEPSEEQAEEEAFEESILFSDVGKIDLFVQMNAPSHCTAEETERYKEAVQKACHRFESNLQILVRELSFRSSKATKKKKNKKKSVAKRCKREMIYEATPIASQNAENHESIDPLDDDFACGDEEQENTQTTVSLDDESLQLSLQSTQQEWISEQDERYLRRKKRESERSPVQKAEEISGQQEQSQEEAAGRTVTFVEAHQDQSQEEEANEQSQAADHNQTVSAAATQNTVFQDSEQQVTPDQNIVTKATEASNTNEGISDCATVDQHQQVTSQQTKETVTEPSAMLTDKLQKEAETSKNNNLRDNCTNQGHNEKREMRESSPGETLANLCQTYQSTTKSSGAVAGHDDLQGEDSSNNVAAPGSSFTGKDSSILIGNNETMEPKSLTTRELNQITDNLSEERLIGQGAFGKVYKGVLDNEDIAVKVLNDNLRATEDDEFQHEFDNLVMLNHPNIVRLVAYCFETQRPRMGFEGRTVFAESTRRALCFEFMHKGSLEGHLSDESHGLDWKTRYKIIKGACEGLKYLHGLRKPIFHLDLKPDNILLDENMTPKLADFGLSKLCGTEQTRVTLNVSGTIGYMPVEYLSQHLVSNKVDVYSMGVVITKIIAGPRGQTRSAEMSNQEFLDQVNEHWRKRLEATCTSSRILDAYCDQVILCTEIGLSSMDNEKDKRPSIRQIIDRLDETETMIEKAISWSAMSRSSMPGKPQRQKDEDMVKVEAFARNKAIKLTETCDEFPILVRVTGAPWRRAEEMPRAGMDVVLAFNPEVAYMKKVMMMLVDRLSPNDRLSILFCGPQQPKMQHVLELTYMSDYGRDVARLKIDELAEFHVHVTIEYFGPVLPEAAQILRQRGVKESGSRAGCILHVWAGRMSPEMHEQDISQEFPVHTIAIGQHTARDMKHIADMTSGTYHNYNWSDFIEPNNILALFLAYIASAPWRPFRITLQANEGVTISSIASGHYSNLVSSEKQSATVDLDNMYAGEQKTFVIYLTVPQGKEKLVTIGGRYQRLNRSEELVGMDVVVLRPRRKCLPHEVAIHPKVAAELLRIQLKEGIARQTQDLSRNNLRLLLEEIKNSDEGRAAPEEILSELEEEVAEMTDRYTVNMESMLSSQNCHQLQRSTTKGTPPDVGAFQILEQQRVDEHNNLVKIQGLTRSKAIRHGETCNEFAVMVRVTVAPWRHGWQMPRDGVDIVAVLDISTNMQGEMLELIKQAMMIVIDKLGPDDRLSIVPFPTSKHRLMELTYMSDDHGHGRDAARFKITQLKASSGSYMGDTARAALEEGAQILRDREAEGSSSRLGCMILLSDGKYPEILQIKISPEFPVHTFGLGADHNPNVMKYIADMTSGTYSFVAQAMSNIKGALALFITGLTSIAVRSITITLRPDYDIAISSIESGNYIHHVTYSKTSGTIIIDHIYAGEQKDFIINLIVGSGRKKLMTIGGQYKCFKQIISIAEIEMSVLRPRSTSSPDKFAIHPDVAAELMRIRLQNGVLDMLDTQKMTTEGLQQLWNMIKHSDKCCGAPEVTVSGLNMDVAEMNRDISGMPYTMSWLSCHKWQRATTKGTLDNSSSFRTIGQYADEDTNLVKVETFTRSKVIPSDDPCNNFPVLVRVMVAPRQHAEEMPRAGVDVVAVLDVSGGMQGEKLERMKEAMMVVIDKLRAEDRLSIVSFNTHENRLTRLTYMTDHGRDVARLKINKLVAGGQGDIAAALREGAEILWWREAESSRRVGCIVFLSDCKNNEIFEAEIRPEIPVHAFGLGTDHNPIMMKYIADITSGTYSFVNQDIGMIKDALSLFITGLTSVAAMSIKITLRTNDGITMSSIESGGYVNQVKDNQFGTIDIDNIYASEQKDFIVYLRVAEGKKELMTIGGQYLSHTTVNHLAYTDVYVVRPQQECVAGDLAVHPEVAAELVRIRLEKGISTMLEKGPTIVGLQQLWEEIMDTDEGRGAPEDTMSSLSMDVTEMKRDIENPKESGLRYTLSWLTSRKWQRATIKGTPFNSDAFQTTRQDADGRATLSQ